MKAITKLVQEGEFAVAVTVERIESDTGWGPYLSIADARKLDESRAALRSGDLQTAARYGKLYRLTPLTA